MNRAKYRVLLLFLLLAAVAAGIVYYVNTQSAQNAAPDAYLVRENETPWERAA